MKCISQIRVKVVDTLPDVINTIYLLPKEVKDTHGRTATVYEEYMYFREKVGETDPKDWKEVLQGEEHSK